MKSGSRSGKINTEQERGINYKSKWNLLTEFESIECDRDDVAHGVVNRAE